jgi:hypothetical protein
VDILNKKPLVPLKVTHHLTKTQIYNIKKALGLSKSTSDAMTLKALCKSVGSKRVRIE